jgi:hypothetical protein
LNKITKAILFFTVAVVAASFLVTVVSNSKADCVTLYVDYGPLNNGSKTTTCIPVGGKINALDLLASANLSTQGTQDYGDAILCRLGGFPDVAVETCEVMPPAESYWAVLIKEHEIIPNPFNLQGEWGWAQVGINEVYLNAGDSLGLVFADNGEVPIP